MKIVIIFCIFFSSSIPCYSGIECDFLEVGGKGQLVGEGDNMSLDALWVLLVSAADLLA